MASGLRPDEAAPAAARMAGVRRVLLRNGPAFRDGATLAGFVGLAYLVVATVAQGGGVDQPAFWGIDPGNLYDAPAWGAGGARAYSPAFYWLISPLSALSYPAFVAAWALLMAATLVWVVGIGPLLLPAVLWVGVVGEIQGGNIHMLLAAALILGFRCPSAWGLVLLTKVTPGIGLLWFAVRREWTSLALALATTAAMVVVLWPLGQWDVWVRQLVSLAEGNGGATATSLGFPLTVRLPVAGVLVIWGALTDRRWIVPIAAGLAAPTVVVSLSMAVAAIRLRAAASE